MRSKFHPPCRRLRGLSIAALVLSAAAPARAGEGTYAVGLSWTHYAGDAARQSLSARAPRTLSIVPWTTGPCEEYVWASSPVVFGGRVFVNARYLEDNLHVNNKLIAYDAFKGDALWETFIEPDAFDSWSSPAVDANHETVLLGCARQLYACDAETGGIVWQTPLSRNVVNASPAVSGDLSNHGTPANRAFITDFGAASATLYAINVDLFHSTNNPYQPGAIVWTAALNGGSGNSPAYRDGKVFVTSTGGDVRAFTALEGQPLWTQHLSGGGFFGGVTVRDGYLYAATYVFSGGQSNSRLHKLAAATGAPVWQIPCERTCSIPIVLDDGRIFLSGGLNGFGSVAKVQAFQDLGASAVLLWDTHQATGGALSVGGWTLQPVYAHGRLYVGQLPPGGDFDSHINLRILDIALTPNHSRFVTDVYAGAGASAAAAAGWMYSLGSNGLVAFADLQSTDDSIPIDPVDMARLDGN